MTLDVQDGSAVGRFAHPASFLRMRSQRLDRRNWPDTGKAEPVDLDVSWKPLDGPLGGFGEYVMGLPLPGVFHTTGGAADAHDGERYLWLAREGKVASSSAHRAIPQPPLSQRIKAYGGVGSISHVTGGTMAQTLGDNLRMYRRRAGLSQEKLAETAELSVGTVRKAEQGKAVEMATLHKLARALSVETSALLAGGAPVPVDRHDSNRTLLVGLRKALTPVVGLAPQNEVNNSAEDLPTLERALRKAGDLYHADRYEEVARQLPALVDASTAALASAASSDLRTSALTFRSQTYELAGRFLTQTRQYDLAYHALAAAIEDAKAAADTMTGASAVNGLAWLLLRQGRFDDAETLASTTAEVIEPRMSQREGERYAAWGWLALRAAAAAVRNNRAQEAEEHQRMAMMAAVALGGEYSDPRHQWSRFGPVTVAMKAVEATMITGDARTALRQADEGPLSAYGRRKSGRPSGDNWHRHRLDVAQANLALGRHQESMDELTYLRARSPEWLRHQNLGKDVLSGLLHKRKRTLTAEIRSMAVFLEITG
ncbi:helix-turn-helix domain-containing protein [Yinghuangia soli]|uniref:Helix-turn-helix domain-containing protein n=1 Tax=Yinghuangia soli TaxID=2908204 RepID=A0AA41PU19_9ACTN|nr:helix-turn-helix transcriptional regulator [Yinghuangia soli]MCF2525701.1 helix-turn-helix domain-containing protein [Yinghuangia soli]